jgi:hypothetical protein
MEWTWPSRNTARKYKCRRIQGHFDWMTIVCISTINQGLWGNGLWTITFQKWTGQPRVLTWIPQNRNGLASPQSWPESHRTPVGWIRTPTSLQTLTPHITNCSGYSSAGRTGCHSARDVQTPSRKSPWQSSSCHKGKGWAHPVLMSTTGKYVTGKVRLQFQVGVRILLIR